MTKKSTFTPTEAQKATARKALADEKKAIMAAKAKREAEEQAEFEAAVEREAARIAAREAGEPVEDDDDNVGFPSQEEMEAEERKAQEEIEKEMAEAEAAAQAQVEKEVEEQAAKAAEAAAKSEEKAKKAADNKKAAAAAKAKREKIAAEKAERQAKIDAAAAEKAKERVEKNKAKEAKAEAEAVAAAKATPEEKQVATTSGTDLVAQVRPADENIPEILQGMDDTGYDELDPSALSIPRIKIVQPTSKKGSPGFFRHNMTEEEFSEIGIVALDLKMSRAYFDKDDKSRDQPICRSFDFYSPDVADLEGIEQPQHPVCAEKVKGRTVVRCPMAKWQGKNPPPCGEGWNLLCMDDDGLPFWFTATGSGIKAASNYVGTLWLEGRKKLYAHHTVMSLDERTEPHRHYALQLSKPVVIDNETAEKVVPLREALANVSLKAAAAEEEEALAGDKTEGEPDWVNE